MSNAVPEVETFQPHEETNAEIIDFIAAMHQRGMDTPEARAKLVSSAGEIIPVPDELFRVLKYAAQNLAEGRAVSVAPIETQLTTQEAAEFLGMSRPSLIKIVDRGDIPCTKVGRHRRVRLGDLVDYRRRQVGIRRVALQEMVDISLDEGLYEATSGSPEGVR